MWEQFADPCSALPVLLESVPWLNQEPVELTRFIEPPRRRNGLAMIGDELRAVIEGVDMRSAAGRVEEDDSVGHRGVVAVSWCKRIVRCRLKLAAQTSQRDGSESARCAAQKFAACL